MERHRHSQGNQLRREPERYGPLTRGGLFCAVSDIGVGWVGVVASERGLVRLTFPQASCEQATRFIGDAVHAPALFEELLQRLRQYFAGRPVSFPDELDLSPATEFQSRVWQAAQRIPFGETRSYGWVAGEIGVPGAARAVGQALGRNPLPIIIPCHRVVTSGGSPGGFSAGIPLKERLLRLENPGAAGCHLTLVASRYKGTEPS